jgi:hypothetical protein
MALGRGSIFVLDLLGRQAFAFEAEDAAAADVLVRQPWFVRVLDDYCRSHRLERDDRPLRPRPATPAEAAVYGERAKEFPEEALGSVLVTDLGAP